VFLVCPTSYLQALRTTYLEATTCLVVANLNSLLVVLGLKTEQDFNDTFTLF